MTDIPRALYIGAFVCWAIALARWDFREHRLPDALTLPAYPIAGLVVGVVAQQNLGVSATIAVTALAGGWIAHRTADLGLGDVKLLGASALALGITTNPAGASLSALVVAAVFGGTHAAIHLAVTRDRHSHIPLGPSILVAELFALIQG